MEARKQRDRKRPGIRYIFLGHDPSDLLSPSFTFYHFPIMQSNYDSISGLIH
jgi:hypothetical protein